jgi:uncharacterized spore protein YtfJ
MDVNRVFETTLQELERMLSSKSVVGEPIKVDGATVVPLLSVGVGFGAGGGEAQNAKAPGQGMGAGGGGGVKPVAVLVFDENGVRVESIKAAASVIAKIAESATEIARGKWLGEGEAKKPEG